MGLILPRIGTGTGGGVTVVDVLPDVADAKSGTIYFSTTDKTFNIAVELDNTTPATIATSPFVASDQALFLGEFTADPTGTTTDQWYYNTTDDRMKHFTDSDTWIYTTTPDDIIVTYVAWVNTNLADDWVLDDEDAAIAAFEADTRDYVDNIIYYDTAETGLRKIDSYVAPVTTQVLQWVTVVSEDDLTTSLLQTRAGTALELNPYAADQALSDEHGFDLQPTYIDTYLECLTAEAGYVVGERAYAPTSAHFTASSDDTNTTKHTQHLSLIHI